MSRGPLPAEVYWRRRFLLLAALLLVAWGVVTVWPDGGEKQTAEPAPKPSASASASASTSPAADAQEAGDEQSEPRETTVSFEAGGDPCDPESIRMTPHVPPDQTVKGEVTIQLTMSTASKKPCTFRPEAGDVAAVVSAGGNAVWDSDVCRTVSMLDGAVALSPRWSTVATATWSGRGSGQACAKDEGWASPGRYALRIGTLGGEPGKTTFRLGAAPEKDEPADEKKQDEQEKKPEKSSEDEGTEDGAGQ